jgi:hypothetical protein
MPEPAPGAEFSKASIPTLKTAFSPATQKDFMAPAAALG